MALLDNNKLDASCDDLVAQLEIVCSTHRGTCKHLDTLKGVYMKIFQTALILLTSFAASASFADPSLPTKVPASFSKVYVPVGFDSNDNVQIVGVGMFNNSCYRNAETSVRVDEASKTIHLGGLTYQYSGYCLQVMMPFDRVIDLGILKAGSYTVIQETDKRVLGKIDVRATTKSEPDDNLYAPISQAFLQAGKNANIVHLTGEFPLSCMKMTDVKVDVQEDVLVVQPIAAVTNNVPCQKGSFPFSVDTKVNNMKPGRYLMHIRSMNGKAVNNFVNVP